MEKKRCIVVIDDEEDLCFLMKVFFVSHNCDVYTASRLAQGMDLLKTCNPDVVFLDNNLQDGVGWEKTDEIIANFPHCKIVLISAFRPSPPDLNAYENVYMIEKPITYSDLGRFL